MNTTKRLALELILVTSGILLSYLMGDEKMSLFIKYKDIGFIIATIGALWGIYAFMLMIIKPWFDTICSLACAAITIVFGVTLNLHGFFSAICAVGVLLFIIAYYGSAFDIDMARNLVITAIPLILIGWIFHSATNPTQIPEQPNRIVDYNYAEWRLEATIKSKYGCDNTQYKSFIGTENEAIEELKQYKQELCSKLEENYYIGACSLSVYLPDWYIEKYGYPDNTRFWNILK